MDPLTIPGVLWVQYSPEVCYLPSNIATLIGSSRHSSWQTSTQIDFRASRPALKWQIGSFVHNNRCSCNYFALERDFIEIALNFSRNYILVSCKKITLVTNICFPFQKASQLACMLGIPRIYISANSGARIGLAEEVKHLINVAWEDPNEPDKVKYRNRITNANFNKTQLKNRQKIYISSVVYVWSSRKMQDS